MMSDEQQKFQNDAPNQGAQGQFHSDVTINNYYGVWKDLSQHLADKPGEQEQWEEVNWYAGDEFPEPYRNGLYVALWNGDSPRVTYVRLDEQAGQITGTAETFMGGLERPIALLPDPRGGLLVVDDTAGVVYRMVAEG
jgi:hypothetical protein